MGFHSEKKSITCFLVCSLLGGQPHPAVTTLQRFPSSVHCGLKSAVGGVNELILLIFLQFAVAHLCSHGPSAPGITISFSCVSVHEAEPA